MAWQAMGEDRPSLRLANLARLRHPMSVDLYVERVVVHARAVMVRLLGGLDYFPYGAAEFSSVCRAQGIPLAIVPGDARDDPRLSALCTASAADVALLDAYLRHGGPDNLGLALRLAAQLGGMGISPCASPSPLPNAGIFSFTRQLDPRPALGTAAIVFYRSHLLAGDVAPVEALSDALRRRGLDVRALYVSSLKDPSVGQFVADQLREWRPAVVVNATGFAAGHEGAGSPLDAAGAPVLQVILASAAKEAWSASSRGLSQSDMAMQVVLPELDGRLLTTAISFKAETAPVPGLDFSRVVNCPDPDGIALAADRALGWARLAATPAAGRRIAIVLSDYPGAGGGQVGHAVGLDTFLSLAAILDDLTQAGYDAGTPHDAAGLTQLLCRAPPTPFLALPTYKTMFGALPDATREKLHAAWGEPEADPMLNGEKFALRHVVLGNVVVAVQPDRGNSLDRKATYHDPDLPPRHAYVAFYLWLRDVAKIDALVHLGTHGTLEWLPGKAVALSDACLPAALTRGLPVIYPFIVNNPGEAAAAKRRLGAVTIGHLTPPLRAAGAHGAAAELERLIDEYAAADGLDRRRARTLRGEILQRAEAAGLLAESGVARDAPDEEALARLDAYLCDVKDLQIRDGLHVYGRAPSPERRTMLLHAIKDATTTLDASAPAERAALLAALDGRFVAAGPAGAPTRGRADVLPTGRNLFTIDPRAVPTRSAVVLAETAAADLLRRYVQDHGDWPRALVVDLWGSATLRTGGEDFALALVLLGVRPMWDEGSARVNGIEVLPLAVLDRPRVDATLRVSGLFRDAFEAQILLFDAAVRAVAARDEADDFNPLAAAARGLEGTALHRATSRVFGAAPGSYGAGLSDVLDRNAWARREELGDAYLAASAHAYGRDQPGSCGHHGILRARRCGRCVRAPAGPRRDRSAGGHGIRCARGRVRRGRRTSSRRAGALSPGHVTPGHPAHPHHRRGTGRVRARPRRKSRLDRRHDAARLSRRCGNGPRARRPARLRGNAAAAARCAVRSAVRCDARRRHGRCVPARAQCGGARRNGREVSRCAAPRPVAPAPQCGGGHLMRQGWCPTLHAPMPSGDGLLVRVRPPGGILRAAAARTLAQAARTHGNGAIELTSRASLQLRGFRPDTAPRFAAEMVAAGLAHPDPAAERRRSVIAPPLMGDDPSASRDAAKVVAALEYMLEREPQLAALPDKFGIAIDAGGVLPTGAAPADILVRLRDTPVVQLNGSDLAAACPPAEVVNAVHRIALAFLGLGAEHRRMRALLAQVGAEAVFTATGLSPTQTVRLSPAPTALGWLPYPGTSKGAFGVGLPFGATGAAGLTALADLGEKFGDGTLRLTPWRAFVIPGVTDPAVLRANLEVLGLITAPDDPRARIVTCPGKPLCSSATVPARADAARIVAMEFSGRIHVSGCGKGCAHPGAADITLVGDEGRYAIVRHGRASDPPLRRGLTLAEALAALQAEAFA